MDTYEAKELMEDSLRCLARMMEQIRLREIEKVVGYDEPMQDHLAQCVSPVPPYEDMDFDKCLEYIKDLHQGFKEASDHEIKLERLFAPANFEVGHICDMVMGFIGHGFSDDLVACAQEIYQVAKEVLPRGRNYVKSEKGCKRMLEAFVPKAKDIIEKHGYKTWADGDYSLPLGYLETWMKRQYWGVKTE